MFAVESMSRILQLLAAIVEAYSAKKLFVYLFIGMIHRLKLNPSMLARVSKISFSRDVASEGQYICHFDIRQWILR